jgi:type I restriction-modification system DNA methylase subunit
MTAVELFSASLTLDIFPTTLRSASIAALAAVEVLASQGGVEARGAVFTRREVVDFILDLAGYTPDKPLHEMRLLEPSFGGGDFLLPTVERLLAAWRIHGDGGSAFEDLKNAIRAIELHRDTFHITRRALLGYLKASEIAGLVANQLADVWLVQGDFLLAPLEGHFDFVVGNPPYVRQELIPEALLREYRARYATIYDRADLYISTTGRKSPSARRTISGRLTAKARSASRLARSRVG